MRSFIATYLDLPRVRLALLAALFTSYFGSLWLGALHFPHTYDWRRNAISNLLSPRDNPHGYGLPCAGVAMAGVFMLALAAWIEGELGDAGTKLARRVRRPAFLAGIGCLSLAAVIVPQHIHTQLGTRHLHEILARTSAGGLGIGMLAACVTAATDAQNRKLRALRVLWRVIAVPPVAAGVVSGLVVALAGLGGIPAEAAAYFRGTVFWHLAFWEWVGSAVVFLFFAAPVLMLGKSE